MSRGVATAASSGNAPVANNDIGLAVEPRVIHEPVRRWVVSPKRPRPDAGKILRACAGDIGRNSHPNQTIAAQIDHPQRSLDPNLCAAPRFKLRPFNREGGGAADAAITQDRFDETHLDAAAEVNDTEPLGWNQRRLGIAEPARAEAIAKRIRETTLI